jgi:tetratricopeptide (TPR) repeat protein
MPQPQRPESEEIPVILPTTTPGPFENTDASGRRKGRITARLVTFGFGCILVSLAVGVFVFLPDMVERPVADRPVAEPLRDATGNAEQPYGGAAEDSRQATSGLDAAPARRDAEQAVGNLLRRQAALEAQGITVWAAKDYSSALEKADAGNLFFARGEFREALTRYNEALGLLESLQDSKAARLAAALDAGDRALADGNGPEARSQFARALAIDATNVRAQQGAARAKNVEEMTRLLSDARQHEENGELSLARTVYREAVALDPQAQAARTALQRVENTLAVERFRASMSEALSAIEQQDFSSARRALDTARGIDPASVAVADAETRLNESVQRQQIAENRARAQRFQQAEQWADAARAYAAILAIDPDIQFAIAGEATSRDFARLHEQLDRYLQEPSRLYSPRPLQAAEQLMSNAAQTPHPGQLLQRKLNSLTQLIAAAKSPVPVVLLSDDVTEVMLYQVGDLGSFAKRELALRPGHYTATGKRTGYRDVRRTFTVTAGQSLAPIVVRCEEKI